MNSYRKSWCVSWQTCFPAPCTFDCSGQVGAADATVWQLARDHGCALITKDEDFHRLGVLHGAPPKLIWLRVGNCGTEDIADLLRSRAEDIRRFMTHSEATILELA